MGRRPIDFKALKETVTPRMARQILGLSTQLSLRGEAFCPCPDAACRTRRGREATMNHQILYCHRCGRSWDAVGLFAYVSGLPQYDAALALCSQLGIAPPFIP